MLVKIAKEGIQEVDEDFAGVAVKVGIQSPYRLVGIPLEINLAEMKVGCIINGRVCTASGTRVSFKVDPRRAIKLLNPALQLIPFLDEGFVTALTQSCCYI
jgi:hypothetical protein